MPHKHCFTQSRIRKHRFFLYAIACLLFVHLGSAPKAEAFSSSHVSAITAHRTFTAPAHDVEEHVLLKFEDGKTSNAAALALTWRTDMSSWIPSSSLVLESDTGLLPNGESALTLRRVSPEPGRTYEASLSYQPSTGVIAVAMYDKDEQQYVLQYDGRVNTTTTTLRAAALGEVTQSNVYEPLGARWTILTGPEHNKQASSLLSSYNESVWLRLLTTDPANGSFQLIIANDSSEKSVPLGRPRDGEAVFPLDTALFPLGLSTLRLQYVLNEEVVWQSRPRTMQTGFVNAAIEHADFTEDATSLRLPVSLWTESSLSAPIDFTLTATVSEMNWNESEAQYENTFHSQYEHRIASATPLTTERQTDEIALPLPAENGLWHVKLQLQAEPSVAIDLSGDVVRFSTISNVVLGTEEVPHAMRICSYNMLGFEGYPMQPSISYLGDMNDLRRVNHFANVIRSLGCHIIGVQEAHSVEMMKRIAQTIDTNLVAFPSASRFPGGIYTDFPVLETRLFHHAGPSNNNEPFSRFGGATLLDIDGKETWVLNFHAWPHEEEMREQEANILRHQLLRLTEISPHVIVMGDFNSEVGGPFDRVLTELGLVNVMGLEWIGIQSTIPNGDKAIDHIYVSSDLVPYITSGRIHTGLGFDSPNPLGSGEWYNSDHYPVVVELTWP